MKKEKDKKEEPINEQAIDQEYYIPEEAQELKEPEQSSKGDEYLQLAQRIQADFDNYRKRNVSLRADALTEGKLETIKAFLPVLDNLGRALEQEEAGSGALYDGLTLIYKQTEQILSGLGVEEIVAVGQPFDPNVHHAVMQEDAADAEQKGKVLEAFQKGYKMGDKVIRYTMVKVAI